MTMQEPLFLEPETYENLEKAAGEVDLPDDPNQWPQEILQELYKQVPYISDFQPHVEMQKVDAEQGYGIGHVEVKSQTEAPQETDQNALDAAGVRAVRIPFVIKQNKLSPFDLLVTDTAQMLPLTENRLRQAVFRPQSFDVTSRTPGDQSMIGQLYPPYRQNYGFGGGGMSLNAGSMGIGKMGSALEQFVDGPADAEKEKQAAAPAPSALLKTAEQVRAARGKTASVLDTVLPTINTADYASFCGEVTKCAATLYVHRDNIYDALHRVLHTEPEPLSKTAQWEGWVRPTVVQIQHVEGGYLVKEASHHFWNPKSALIGRGELVERFGVKIAADVDTSGAVTLADGAEAEGGQAQDQLAPVTEFGLYKTRDEQGREHVGFVIPNLIDTDGTVLPLQLFTNGSVSTIQTDIMGSPAGAGSNLPSGPVGGHGAFYNVGSDGKVAMTVPLELSGSSSMPGEPAVYHGEAFDGRPVEVSVQPNIRVVMATPEGRMLVPDTWAWLPLEDSQVINLVDGEAAVETETEDEQTEKDSHVVVRSDGQVFAFSGAPVEKLAYDERNVDLDGAMFLLAALGTHQGYGAEKLAEAAHLGHPTPIKTGRSLSMRDDLVKQASADAAAFLATFPRLKTPHLLKEAANFTDPSVVDTVLSLGFINPENVVTFISFLPDLENTQSKLCELLLAVRLGLQDIPQTSVERAVRSLEEVIEGLKILAFQGS